MPQAGYYLPERRLVSQADQAMIERPDVPRSRFTGSWTLKTAFDAGYLIPFLVDEALPGDHLSYDVTAYVRMSTPLFPLFDNQRVDTFFFFVPYRILWDNWKAFMGEQKMPDDDIDYTIPQIASSLGGHPVGSIFDYMGLPTVGQVSDSFNISHSCLPLRAYNSIWNDWFRDENLQDSVAMQRGDGPDTSGHYTLKRRGKAHDYFTTALPWPQKFSPVSMPLGGLAPVIGLGTTTNASATGGIDVLETTGFIAHYDWFNQANIVTSNTLAYKMTDNPGTPAIYADLAQATGVTINTLRQAWLVQSLLERDARGGTRYVELIKSHFGVTSPDFRLQRPELIGTGSTPLAITPIAQTAPTADAPLGALGAAGTAAGQHRASYAATEHGVILGLINIRTELSYQQGIHRMWSRKTRYDFYWPSLAGLGEQAVLRKEIYATGDPANDDAVFGYQERWQEYRAVYSQITGIMRSTEAGTLDAWHLAQKFTAAPVLGDTFIQDTPPMDRVLAAGTAAAKQQYLADILIQRNAVRPIPTYGTPVQLGRF